MRVAAITSLKWAPLREALNEAKISQYELAALMGDDPSKGRVTSWLCLRKRPDDDEMGRLEAAFATKGVYTDFRSAWPEEFAGFGRKKITHEDTRDVPVECLMLAGQPTPLQILEAAEMPADIEKALKMLTVREEKVIRMRFGIGDDEPKTLKAIGDKWGVGQERIRQIQARALRKLRHPRRCKDLMP